MRTYTAISPFILIFLCGLFLLNAPLLAAHPTKPLAACSLTLTSGVSGCYAVNGSSKATLNVEIRWDTPPPGKPLIIITGTQSRTIIPGMRTVTYPDGTTSEIILVSPQVVTFEVDLAATPTTATVTAAFDPTCSATATVTLPPACPPIGCETGQTSGLVFADFNANGQRDPNETSGLAGVTVRATTCTGTQYQTTTNEAGLYAFAGSSALPANGYPVRVEFLNLPAYAGQGTPVGTNGQTTVQFLTAPACQLDLGILDPTDYCQANPKLMVPYYTSGDPSQTAIATDPALLMFDYTLSGLKDASKTTALSTTREVGSLWAVEYDKNYRKLFAAATLRRHTGLGPKGLGGIYVLDPFSTSASKIVAAWAVDSLMGVDVGAGLVPTNANRLLGLYGNSTDPVAWSLTGKVGLGGLDLSDDGRALYFVNLFDKKLYRTDLAAFQTTGTLPTSAVGLALPDPGCVGGQLRPWGLKVHKGKVYVGAVCDGQTDQDRGTLRAYVFEYDPATAQFAPAPVLDMPLTYPKGFPWVGNSDLTNWFAWTDDFDVKQTANQGSIMFLIRPEPILASLEFDIDGSMLLGFADRTGLQSGNANSNLTTLSTSYNGISGGDLLRAAKTGTTFMPENNARANQLLGYGANNRQGPGFGEFYDDDLFNTTNNLSTLDHAELFQGGLALRPGSGEIISTALNPVEGRGNSNKNSGGVRYLSNNTGQYNKAYQVYGSGASFASAASLGDITLRCDSPTYLEAGNLVWLDTDGDGEQDACEKPLEGVNVGLYRAGTLVASTRTNSRGNYYFTYSPTASAVPGSTNALLPNTAYEVVFGTEGQLSGGQLTLNGIAYRLTAARATGPSLSTQTDSDVLPATVAGQSTPTISFTTGAWGTVNHTLDAGFQCLPMDAIRVAVSGASCPANTTVANADARIDLTNLTNANRVFLATTTALPAYTATGGQPVVAGATSFTGLANPATSQGTAYSLVVYNGPCCYTVLAAQLPQVNCQTPCQIRVGRIAAACSQNANNYRLSGVVSVSNATPQTLVISNGVLTAEISIGAGQTEVPFALMGQGWFGNQTSQVLTVRSASCGTATVTYLTPPECGCPTNRCLMIRAERLAP